MTEGIKLRIGPCKLRAAFSIVIDSQPGINLLSEGCQFFEREFSDLHEAVAFLQLAFNPDGKDRQ